MKEREKADNEKREALRRTAAQLTADVLDERITPEEAMLRAGESLCDITLE